jgi:hypothetical protein
LLTKRAERTLDRRKFIKTSLMTCNTSRQKCFAVIISRIMRWGGEGRAARMERRQIQSFGGEN